MDNFEAYLVCLVEPKRPTIKNVIPFRVLEHEEE